MIFDNKSPKIISPYNIGLSIKNLDHSIWKFFENRLRMFADDMSIDSIYLQEVDFNNLFTDVEFNKPIPDENDLSFVNKYLYPIIFSDIKKNENSKLEFKTRYAFTLDISLATHSTKTGIRYGSVFLGRKPIFYYIFIDISEIIQIVKQQ